MSDFLQHFAERFATLNKDNLHLLGELYSDDVVFRDPLHEVRGLTAMHGYFAELYANVEALHFEFHGFDQVDSGEGYLRWTMRYRHPRLRGGAEIAVEGCSHLLWHDKVYRHRDYFDAGALLYEHLPVLGGVIAWLKREAGMKRIWLTGASSGIGAALAEQLLRAGHRLAISARSSDPLQELASRYGDQVLVAPGDLTDPAQVRAIGERIAQQWGALDCAILNAGTCEYVDARQFEAAMIERVVSANLFSASHCIEAALPLLRRGNRPHLVGVGSSVTFMPLPRAEAYGASKAALRYLLQTLRIDLASEGIDVTLVSPGFVDTPLTQNNDFPMPMRWPVERAARYIAERLDKRPHEIAFPTPFIAVLKLLGCLPSRLQLAIGRRLARNEEHA